MKGNHKSPMATGRTPTYTPIRVKTAKKRVLGRGVVTATSIVWSNVTPVDVSSRTTCVSPCTQGYGMRTRSVARCAAVTDGSTSKAQNASSTTT